MNKLTLITLFLVVTALISSCKKEEEKPTVESQLIGLWKIDEIYVDGVLDTESLNIFTWNYELLEGGTGTRNIVGFGEQSSTWSYDVATEELTIIVEELSIPVEGGTITLEGDTAVAKITKLDEANLWLGYDFEGAAIEERYLKGN